MNAFLPFLLLALVSLSGFANAGNEVVFTDGTPGWRVSKKKCTFTVPGKILNQSPEGSLSGSLRLTLWVTRSVLPSSGYRAATYDLGQLRGSYQYSNLNPVTSYSIPNLTGTYYYTVALEQFSDAQWVISDTGTPSVKTLKKGAFVKPKKWNSPKGKIIAPRKSLQVGNNLNLTLQGSQSGGALVYVPNGSQLKIRVKIEENGLTTVYGGSKPEGAPALYTYSTGKANSGGKRSPAGSIMLDYGFQYGIESNSTYSLFFQKKKKGFYKGVDTDQGYSGTSWGIFSIR